MNINIASQHPDICKKMFSLVMQDAGGQAELDRIASLTPEAKKSAEEWYNLTDGN